MNRLLTNLRNFATRPPRRRDAFPFVWVYVWQSDVTGRNPHLHLMMHCPPKHRDELRDTLEGIYEPVWPSNHPTGVIDVSNGSDIRRQHWSGKWGSTLDYITRHKTQQAYMADRSVPRETIRDENGRHRGVKAPIEGKRWAVSKNIDNAAIDAYRAERSARREAERKRKVA